MKDILLIRVKEGTKYSIRAIHRLIGAKINDIPSMCDHTTRVNKHPRDVDLVLESCSTCELIRGYNFDTSENFFVLNGSTFAHMFEGPAGSLFVVDTLGKLFKLDWDEDQLHKAKLTYSTVISAVGKELLNIHYVECHDILLCTMKHWEDDENYEIKAVDLKNVTKLWKLSGPVAGHTIKPECITCDQEGNAYISDGATNRILKIDSLTGEVLSILLTRDEEAKVLTMHWSNTEPNLTLRTLNRISTYFVPK